MTGNPADFSDEELMLRCIKADADSAREIVGIIAERFHVRLLRHLCRMSLKEAAAEDIVQEVFLRLFRHRRRYETKAKVSTWLFKIAANLALNAMRDEKRKAHLSLSAEIDDEGHDFSSITASKGEKPDETMAKKDLQRIVREILMKVPENHRIALSLCDVEGMSYSEAAKALDVPVGTIRSRLSRAREDFLVRFAIYRGELEGR